MAAIRTAVIQHRLALDILLTEKGGVCKLINASCCFHIPDEFNNITDIIKHMQDSIQPPRQTNTSWLSWLESWSQDWLSWILTMIMPILMIFCLVCPLTPCLLKCMVNGVVKNMTTTPTFLQEDTEHNVAWKRAVICTSIFELD
ncbi:hypothetical protein NQD34_002835 [Periophthalmus magnuspinnatus]|nr:hypothetical protein NQD34_002835 [Periophthalmus magnuspinnatus]